MGDDDVSQISYEINGPGSSPSLMPMRCSDPLQLWNYIIKRSGEFNVFMSAARGSPTTLRSSARYFRHGRIRSALSRDARRAEIEEERRREPEKNRGRESSHHDRRVTCVARHNNFRLYSRAKLPEFVSRHCQSPPAIRYLRTIRIIFLSPLADVS